MFSLEVSSNLIYFVNVNYDGIGMFYINNNNLYFTIFDYHICYDVNIIYFSNQDYSFSLKKYILYGCSITSWYDYQIKLKFTNTFEPNYPKIKISEKDIESDILYNYESTFNIIANNK